jgi:cold shock CspA family protein|tara:strand:+ start:27 stop:530 length:504 start_codon:yes stop_codon:yes gene_type:complete
MSDTNDTTPNVENSDLLLGRVKWFNNRAGFGFVTVLSGDKKNEDVFVHHSGINVDTEQYKYLVQGEYVSFVLKSSDSTDHPYQAGSVRGVLEGPLMCETRNENRSAREGEDDGQSREPRRGQSRGRGQNNRNVRPRGGGPRSYNKPNDGQSWVLERSNNSVDNSEDA